MKYLYLLLFVLLTTYPTVILSSEQSNEMNYDNLQNESFDNLKKLHHATYSITSSTHLNRKYYSQKQQVVAEVIRRMRERKTEQKQNIITYTNEEWELVMSIPHYNQTLKKSVATWTELSNYHPQANDDKQTIKCIDLAWELHKILPERGVPGYQEDSIYELANNLYCEINKISPEKFAEYTSPSTQKNNNALSEHMKRIQNHNKNESQHQKINCNCTIG